MKNRQGVVLAPLLIIIGAVVVAGFTTYFLIQNNNGDESKNTNIAVVDQANSNVNTNSATNTNQVANNNASVNSNTAVNTNTTSNTNAATDPTAGWKTYTNTRFGFTLKHPTNWAIQSVDGTSGAESSSGDRIIFWSKQNYKSLIPEGTEWVPTETLYQFVVKANDTSRSQHMSDPNITLVSSESATIDGETGTKDTFKGPYGEWTTVYVTHNTVSFGIQIPQLTDEQKRIASQILSTFQFTN